VPPETPSTDQGRTQDILKAEVSIENYKIIAEWIRFADAKAGVTLTVNGVYLGLMLPTLKAYLTDKTTVHPTTWWEVLVIVLFVMWLAAVILSAVNAFLCILPFRGHGRLTALTHATHFHPAAVAGKYGISDLSAFLSDSTALGMTGLQREVLAAILVDSHLSNEKYGYVTRAIWCLAGSAVFGFFYLLTIQF